MKGMTTNDLSNPTSYDLIADIYDALYADWHAGADDIEFYKRYAVLSSTPVLDLGCGTGRIAIALAEAGVEVIGIDVSVGMLAKAQAKAKALPKSARKRLRFICSDVRRYKLAASFDFAYFGFLSFMHLLRREDQVQALNNTFAHLSRGGKLVVTLLVPAFDKLVTYKTSSATGYQHVREFKHSDVKHRVVGIEQTWYDRDWQVSIHKIVYTVIDEQDGEIEQREFTLMLRWMNKYELERLVRYCGFEVENIYHEDYQGTLFPEGSKEMICVVRRPL